MQQRNPTCARRSGEGLIRFRILAADCELGEAETDVLARPCGKKRVDGEDAYGRVLVHDAAGCFLDEPEDDLVDREGYAARVEVPASAEMPYPECRWEIVSLCCAEDTCQAGGA